MKIFKVEATNPDTKQRQTFLFGSGPAAVTSKGGKLAGYLEYLFADGAKCPCDVAAEFEASGETFRLLKSRTEDGADVRITLKKRVEGKLQVIARGKAALQQVAALTGELDGNRKFFYVSNKAVENFDGDLSAFRRVRVFAEIGKSVEATSDEIREKSRLAREKLLRLSEKRGKADPKVVEQLSAELDSVNKELVETSAQLSALRQKNEVSAVTGEILAELSAAQESYNKLVAEKDSIEILRKKLAMYDKTAAVLPSLRRLKTVEAERKKYESQRYEVTSELEWRENELAGVNVQLEEKQKQATLFADRRMKIEAINSELTTIADLYEKNKQLNSSLDSLGEQSERILTERVQLKNKLDGIEKSIEEVNSSLEKFALPGKSVGELLETVRIDVKIEEINSQIERIRRDVAVKESKIAEKESTLVEEMKRFKSVAELDVTVAPVKAKDTILQVLDAKYDKLAAINKSLTEKRRNLTRALEDYRHRILQLEHSKAMLEGELENVRQKKQEEFKREVYLNSQKVFSDDATGVFAVTVNLNDGEVETLRQDVVKRGLDRDLLLEKASELDGMISEISRHIDINEAEMRTLRQEKDNINSRYREIVSQNRNESVFNYLKALENDTGTKYLLDVQQQAVRSETELSEAKTAVEGLKSRLEALEERKSRLEETQSRLDSERNAVDSIVSANEQLRDELAEVSSRLAANYRQYRDVKELLDQLDDKYDKITEQIVEVKKTVKANEATIAAANEKAQRYAGTEDLEQALNDFRYETEDVDSELNVLTEAKSAAEKEVFRRRLELEKLQWLAEGKEAEYNKLYDEVRLELNVMGVKADDVDADLLNMDCKQVRGVIEQYDRRRRTLAEKIENYYVLLKKQPSATLSEKAVSEMKALSHKAEQLTELRDRLAEKRAEAMELYAAASSAEMRLAVAAKEAQTLTEMKSVLKQNEIVSLLVADKIKSLLDVPNNILSSFGEDVTLSANGCALTLSRGGEAAAYSELPQKDKFAVYLALVLGLSDADGRNIVFDERNIGKEALNNLLSCVSDAQYVVEYAENQVQTEVKNDIR